MENFEYQAGQAISLKKGSIVKIPGGVKHWHGASKNSWFIHIALEDWSKDSRSG